MQTSSPACSLLQFVHIMVSTLGERFLVWPVHDVFFFSGWVVPGFPVVASAPGFGVFVAGHHQSAGWRPSYMPFAMLGFLDSLGGKKWEKHILVALVGALEHGWIIFCHILGMSWSQLTHIFQRARSPTNQYRYHWQIPPGMVRRCPNCLTFGGSNVEIDYRSLDTFQEWHVMN